MTIELEEILLHHESDAMGSPSTRQMKFVVIGDSSVGKTSICKRVASNTFKSFYTQSIGVNFNTTNFVVNDEKVVVQHLDIAAFEKLSGMTQQYYRGCVGALVLFDLTSERSFEATEFWKKDVDMKCCTSTQDKIPCLLVGTKCDLKEKQQFIKTDEEFEKYAKDNNYIGFIQVSSLENINVTTAFEKLISYVIENNITPMDLPVSEENEDTTRRWCCC
ncbi:Ras-related protein Rab-32A [Tritrichomonas foetus]|uniref:Ras-related protein Rab-32A n=1 Tax=Tritrichomonas foetus TaxID=1144522 RepID=A0A1J4L1T1_9EUKA|nr:Ras-related protein Rab-32A [Tritrichomonas foetus]|eukprot:OHT17395.1 Ras-related protein Rab-32A [Tritrichomonas foetus]